VNLTGTSSARLYDSARFGLLPLALKLFARFPLVLPKLGNERVGKCRERITVFEKSETGDVAVNVADGFFAGVTVDELGQRLGANQHFAR
jgi:hypothetical protein